MLHPARRASRLKLSEGRGDSAATHLGAEPFFPRKASPVSEIHAFTRSRKAVTIAPGRRAAEAVSKN